MEYEIIVDKFKCPHCGTIIKVKTLPEEYSYPLQGNIRVNCPSCKSQWIRKY